MKIRRDWFEFYTSKHLCLHYNEDVNVVGNKIVGPLGPLGPSGMFASGIFTLYGTGIGPL